MRRRYLLIDDNPHFAENVAEILTDAGAEVTLASGGDAALAALRTQRFEGVVTDMKMPGLSGAQVVQRLREIDPGVPVILLSAFANDVQVEEARRYGLLALLDKHNSMGRLIELLQHARRDATVVLVEDDLALCDTITEALSAHGFTVCATDALDELARLSITPLAALVDLRIRGEVDGDSLRAVRARFPGVPVIVLTGLPPPLDTGDAELLHKPFDLGVVLQRLEALASAS